jgi:hypothetical protein
LPDGWHERARLIVLREPLHPGGKRTINDFDSCRVTAVLTDQTDADIVAFDGATAPALAPRTALARSTSGAWPTFFTGASSPATPPGYSRH